MPLSLRPGTLADVKRMADIYFDAFSTNTMNARVFPKSLPESHVFWEKNIADGFKDTYSNFVLMVDDDTQETVAFAIWGSPRLPTDTTPSMPPVDTFPAGGDRDNARVFFSDLEQQHKRFMTADDGSHIPHWYLELIATHKDHQGKGAASALLRWGEQRADADQVPCYLDATPDGRPVYTSKSHGFREVDARTYMGGEYEHVFMIRDPKPVAK
ncbi:gnat family [Ophiostoma piceae UAMH 11346]|uniref:Gnat family n=1 Tax=Ophiostoma piceae (strain UAMH 11346) TaxID=1262450 RepID=S3C6E3_OPHP1|nr:gnat family [Ophiostoma piceae UAMH 11346]